MSKIICANCQKVYDDLNNGKCPIADYHKVYNFEASDRFLKEKVRLAKEERKNLGLVGLVGDLNNIIINVEPENLKDAVQEMVKYTGYHFEKAFEESDFITAVLRLENSADIIFRSRKKENPFREYNLNPKSEHLPNTRLETFVFESKNIHKYFEIQQKENIDFMTDSILEFDNYYFIQTKPSKFMNLSYGIIQWKNKKDYMNQNDVLLDWQFPKPKKEYLKNIGFLDHAASRVKAEERDAAIVEFMKVTNYDFTMAIFVKSSNSITNVTRFEAPSFAMVFTSGIFPFQGVEESGPTEKFIYNYGARTHHLAFITQNIEETYKKLAEDGMEYLIELVGSPEQGLKQTFSQQSPNTFLVNEYILRFGDFTGFFTKNNVTKLTESTDKQ